MRFKVVSAVEAAESLIYTLLLATLAFLHKGIWCYVVAMGCRDLFGSVAFNLIARPPFRKFSWASLRPHVGFSLVYQGGSLLNMVTLAFPPIMIARLLGKNAVGYVSWASTLSLYPLVICNAMAPYLPACIQQRSRRSSLAAYAGGEIVAHQCQHCVAGLRRAGQSEYAHHCVYLHAEVVPGAAAALRLLRQCGHDRGGRASDANCFSHRMTRGSICASVCGGPSRRGPSAPTRFTTMGCLDSPFSRRRCKAHGCWLSARPEDGRTASLCAIARALFLGAALVLGNLLLIHSIALSSIYRLGAVLAVEA